MGRELRKRRILGHMDSRKYEEIRGPIAPVLYVEECTSEPGFLSEAYFALSQGRRIAKWISECPDRPSQRTFDFYFAVSNLAARFFFAAQRQNGM
jgi:hypothetical protein